MTGGGGPVSVPSDDESTPVSVDAVVVVGGVVVAVVAVSADELAGWVAPAVGELVVGEHSVSHTAGEPSSPHAKASKVDNAHCRCFTGTSVSRAAPSRSPQSGKMAADRRMAEPIGL